MKLREFLQIEIWSKRTSRRILIGLVVIAFGFALFYAVSTRWTSPAERNAGREALARIDTLQSLLNGSDEEYGAVDSQAKKKVDEAGQSSLTLRDKQIVAALSVYLDLIEMEKSDQKFRLKVSSSSDERLRKMALQNPQTFRVRQQVRDLLNHNLHRVLD